MKSLSLARGWPPALLVVAAALFVVSLLGAGCGPSNAVTSACPGSSPCVHFVGNVGTGTGGNGAGDGAADAPEDMAHAASAHDLAAAAGDLATAAGDLAAAGGDMLACLPTGGACPNHDDAICCSKYCVYATNTCK